MVSFLCFWGIFGWLGLARDWFHSKQRVSPFYHQHLVLTQALEGNRLHLEPPFLESQSLDTVVVSEVDELEEDVE